MTNLNEQTSDTGSSNAEFIEALTENENLYAFLSAVFLREITPKLWEAVLELRRKSGFEGFEPEEAKKALLEWLDHPGEDPVTALAVDYARVFLGAGVAKGTMAVPYESVYTSRGGLIMQDAWEAVKKICALEGIVKKDEDLLEDHLGLELAFMAAMIGKSKAALAKDDEKEALRCIKVQHDFLVGHILVWVKKLSEDVHKCSSLPFYPAMIDFTINFLEANEKDFALVLNMND